MYIYIAYAYVRLYDVCVCVICVHLVPPNEISITIMIMNNDIYTLYIYTVYIYSSPKMGGWELEALANSRPMSKGADSMACAYIVCL